MLPRSFQRARREIHAPVARNCVGTERRVPTYCQIAQKFPRLQAPSFFFFLCIRTWTLSRPFGAHTTSGHRHVSSSFPALPSRGHTRVCVCVCARRPLHMHTCISTHALLHTRTPPASVHLSTRACARATFPCRCCCTCAHVHAPLPAQHARARTHARTQRTRPSPRGTRTLLPAHACAHLRARRQVSARAPPLPSARGGRTGGRAHASPFPPPPPRLSWAGIRPRPMTALTPPGCHSDGPGCRSRTCACATAPGPSPSVPPPPLNTHTPGGR